MRVHVYTATARDAAPEDVMASYEAWTRWADSKAVQQARPFATSGAGRRACASHHPGLRVPAQSQLCPTATCDVCLPHAVQDAATAVMH